MGSDDDILYPYYYIQVKSGEFDRSEELLAKTIKYFTYCPICGNDEIASFCRLQ